MGKDFFYIQYRFTYSLQISCLLMFSFWFNQTTENDGFTSGNALHNVCGREGGSGTGLMFACSQNKLGKTLSHNVTREDQQLILFRKFQQIFTSIDTKSLFISANIVQNIIWFKKRWSTLNTITKKQ